MKNNSSAFTLVELIVVITILAVLGTIAFISFLGYTQSARDSVRISDLKVISKSLELYKLETDIYPTPSGSVGITFSGSEIWGQGTVGKSVIQDMRRLTSVPLDPLTKTEYTYSRTYKRNEYQLGALFEGDLLSKNKIISQTYAGDNIGYAYVTGQYNGKIINIQISNTLYILAVPTIINGDLSITDIEQLIADGKLVLKGEANLPASYSGTTYNTNGGGNLKVIEPSTLIVFSGSLNDLTGDDPTARKQLVLNLQSAYSGTVTQTSGGESVTQLLGINPSDDMQIESFASVLVNNELGGKILVSNEGDTSGSGSQVTPPSGIGAITITFPGGNETITCTSCY